MSPGTNHGIGWGTNNYHPGKKAGDLTDSGEIAIMLLDYLAKGEKYSFDGYSLYWKHEIDNGYGSCNFQTVLSGHSCPKGTKPGYLNGGTRQTLQNLMRYPDARGRQRMELAANVNCLIAATHFLPIFFTSSDEETLVNDAISTVYLSHKNRDPIYAAEFLSRTLYKLFYDNLGLEEALNLAAAKVNDPFISEKLYDAKKKVQEATDPNSQLSKEEFVDDIALTSMARLWDVGKTEPIKVGKASPTEGALPGALYIALKYQNSLEEALIANANIGGDSAARGMVIGMLLGAIHGKGAIPERWLSALNSLSHVEKQFEVMKSIYSSHSTNEL